MLVLAVLTVSFSPAGRTIRLLAPMYFDRNSVAVSVAAAAPGSPSRAFLFPSLGQSHANPRKAVKILSLNTSRSSVLSRTLAELQQLEPTRSSSRYGAFQYNDSLALNLTINWPWVKANLPFILYNQALIEGAAALLGLPLSLSGSLLSNVNTTIQLPANTNLTALFLGLGQGPATGNATQAALTSALGRNTTATLTALLTPPGGAANANSSQQATVTASTVSYSPLDGTVRLTGVTLRSGNASVSLGNVSLPAETAVAFLPTGTFRTLQY